VNYKIELLFESRKYLKLLLAHSHCEPVWKFPFELNFPTILCYEVGLEPKSNRSPNFVFLTWILKSLFISFPSLGWRLLRFTSFCIGVHTIFFPSFELLSTWLLEPRLTCSFSWPPCGSLDSILDVASNTYLVYAHQYYNSFLDPCTNAQWLLSSCPFLSTSSFPPWKCLGGLFVLNHLVILYSCPSPNIVLAHKPHQHS
jgi:hypothetical protein